MTGRETILEGIRKGLAGRDSPDRDPERPMPERKPDPGQMLRLFGQRLTEAHGTFETGSATDVPALVRRHVERNGLGTAVAVTDGLRRLDWRGAGLELSDGRPEDADVGVTGALCAVAETGSLLIGSSAAGEIELSLLPTHHVCMVDAGRIVADMADAIALAVTPPDPLPRNLTLVTGPSVTADIEQTLVQGAHGPLSLHVIVETSSG